MGRERRTQATGFAQLVGTYPAAPSNVSWAVVMHVPSWCLHSSSQMWSAEMSTGVSSMCAAPAARYSALTPSSTTNVAVGWAPALGMVK